MLASVWHLFKVLIVLDFLPVVCASLRPGGYYLAALRAAFYQVHSTKR